MSLLNWLYDHKNELNLKISLAEWPERSGFNLHDVEMNISYEGQNYVGRGLDAHETIAIKKASSEVVEHLISSILKINTTGLSVADADFDSEEHAKCEVLERCFLKEHMERELPLVISDVDSEFSSYFKKNNSGKVLFFEIKVPEGYFGYGCILRVSDIISTGFAVSKSQNHATNKSFLEALPNFYWLKENEISEADKPWHLRLPFVTQLSLLIKPEKNIVLNIPKMPKMRKIEINLDNYSILKTIPVYVSKYEVVNEP